MNKEMHRESEKRSLFCKPGWMFAFLLICFVQLFFSNNLFSQQSAAYTIARAKLLKTLKKKTIDKVWTQSVDRFYFTSCDSLIDQNVTIENRPIEMILTKLFDVCDFKINNRSISLLRIPSVNNSFLLTIEKYKKQPLQNLYREIGITQTAILETAFEGLKLGDSISTFAGFREMLNTPYYISTRLHHSRYLPYKDTLLYFLANGAPAILAENLADNDSLITALVKNSHNITVKAVAQIKKNIYYEQTLPFGLAILENRITADSVRKLALIPQDYYHAFVNEVIRLFTHQEPQVKSFLQQPIADINKTLANKYFISEINMLHESPDKVRFQILNTLTPRELYFLLIGGSGELYTSSFLYIYEKFIKDTEKEGLDNFLSQIGYYQFGQFINNISGYGLVDDLVYHLQEEKFARLLSNYFTTFSNTQLSDNQVILNAMTMSEVLYDLRHHHAINAILLNQLEHIKQSKAPIDILLQRMYAGFRDILLDIGELKTDLTYDLLAIKRLQKQNNIVQVVFFYDDEDGCSSFDNSIFTYASKKWDKKDMGNYIVFNSKRGNKMSVYMNKPMSVPGSDAAQDEMLSAIERDGYEVTSVIHRGHSYHLFQSLRKIAASCQFVFLGSCGGYNEVLKVFQLNPDMNIIVTRNIGSKLINDPMLQKINMEIVNDKDIKWDKIWKSFNSMFKSKQLKDLFSSYIPPNKYIGVKFIRSIYNL